MEPQYADLYPLYRPPPGNTGIVVREIMRRAHKLDDISARFSMTGGILYIYCSAEYRTVSHVKRAIVRTYESLDAHDLYEANVSEFARLGPYGASFDTIVAEAVAGLPELQAAPSLDATYELTCEFACNPLPSLKLFGPLEGALPRQGQMETLAEVFRDQVDEIVRRLQSRAG